MEQQLLALIEKKKFRKKWGVSPDEITDTYDYTTLRLQERNSHDKTGNY